MAKIKDKVSMQLYGDHELQKQILTVLESAGVSLNTTNSKDYVTKRGEEGHYLQIQLTYSDDTSNN